MKLLLPLTLLTSTVYSQGIASTFLPNYQCKTPLECNAINIIFGNFANLLKAKDCMNKATDNEKLQCGLEATGLNSQQSQNFIKRKPFSDTCSKLDDKQVNCINSCSGDDKAGCVNKCFEPTLNEYYSCMAKEAKLDNFDSKKAIECSNKCKQSDLSELFNCDYQCNESLYKKLTGDNIEVKSEKKDNQQTSTSTSTSTQSNSANSNIYLTKAGAGLIVLSSVLSLL